MALLVVDDDGLPQSGRESPIPFEELQEAAKRELQAYSEGPTHDAADLADATSSMQALFRERGYVEAFVDFHVYPSEEAPERIDFEVAPGPQFLLKAEPLLAIEPAGEAMIGLGLEEERKKVLAWLETPKDLFGRMDEAYREAKLQSGAQAIQTFYRLAGYPYAKVEVQVVPFPLSQEDAEDAEETWPIKPLRIEAKITRGPAFRIVGLDLKEGAGDPVAEAALQEVRQLLKLDQDPAASASDFGLPFHPRQVSDVEALLLDALADEGRLYADVSVLAPPIAVAGLEAAFHPLRFEVRIRPNPRVRLASEVLIEGLDRTEEDFIRNRLTLAKGDVVTRQAIEKTLEQIYSTGLFSYAKLEPIAAPLDPSEETTEREMTLSLRELDARSFDTEVGYGSYELARTRVRYRDRNFLGIGRELDASAFASVRSYGAALRFIDPWTLGERNTLEAGLNFDFRARPSFDSTRFEFDLRFRRQLHERGDPVRKIFDLGYRFTANQAESTAPDAILGADDSFVVTAGIFSRLTIDSRDDDLHPTQGSLLQAGVFLSRPELFAELSFFELSFAAAHHIKLSEDDVFALGGRVTTRSILNDDLTLPIQERLFLGGEASVRSFTEDALGPVQSDGEAEGGLTAAFVTLEYRRRLFGDLWGAAFYDLGTVGRDDFDFDDAYGQAIGIGLRYILPFGPVRLDFAINPGRKSPASDAWALHFAFGFSF